MSKIIFPAQLKYLENLRDEKSSLLLEMEDFASENSVPILSWQSGDFLEQLIKISKPAKVLEIGTAIGYSSIRIARNLARKSLLHTIEKSKDNIKLANEYIDRSGFKNKIEILEGDALSIMPKLNKKYDFIFLDADKEDYKKLFDYSILLLKRGGIIFIDNLLWHGHTASKTVPASYRRSTKFIRDFNRLFMAQRNIRTIILPIGDGIGLGIKN